MASDEVSPNEKRGVEYLVDALHHEFGDDAIQVVERQASAATDDTRAVWLLVLNALKAGPICHETPQS